MARSEMSTYVLLRCTLHLQGSSDSSCPYVSEHLLRRIVSSLWVESRENTWVSSDQV